jgi:tetratricopeptide (TPR) repeat protein
MKDRRVNSVSYAYQQYQKSIEILENLECELKKKSLKYKIKEVTLFEGKTERETFLSHVFAENQALKLKVTAIVLDVLRLRDNFEKNHLSPFNNSSVFLEFKLKIKSLDDRLDKLKWLYECICISDYYHFSGFEKPREWWLAPPHFFDKLDEPIFRRGALSCFGVFGAILFDIVSRVSIGGPSVWGVVAVIIPTLFICFLGKDPLEKAERISISVELFFKRFKCIKFLASELSFLVSICSCFVIAEVYNLGLPFISSSICNCESSLVRARIDSDISKAEVDFQRSLAFHPENPESNYWLGWIYENRQELESAKKSYSLSFQNGSVEAVIRLAGIYLNEEKPNSTASAVTLLKKISEQVDTKNEFRLNRSWATLMSEARLNQGRYQESYEILMGNKGRASEREILEKSKDEYFKEGTGLYCVAAQLFDKLILESSHTINSMPESLIRSRKNYEANLIVMKNEISTSIRKINSLSEAVVNPDDNDHEFLWQYCEKMASIEDIDDDRSRGQAKIRGGNLIRNNSVPKSN